jgi:hypothetical protein
MIGLHGGVMHLEDRRSISLLLPSEYSNVVAAGRAAAEKSKHPARKRLANHEDEAEETLKS